MPELPLILALNPSRRLLKGNLSYPSCRLMKGNLSYHAEQASALLPDHTAWLSILSPVSSPKQQPSARDKIMTELEEARQKAANKWNMLEEASALSELEFAVPGASVGTQTNVHELLVPLVPDLEPGDAQPLGLVDAAGVPHQVAVDDKASTIGSGAVLDMIQDPEQVPGCPPAQPDPSDCVALTPPPRPRCTKS